MSVYNAEKFVEDAINSILNQTFSDFEFIIIDDGSTDHSLELIYGFARKDGRIRVIENGANIGLAKSLNKGIAITRGEYIARMDADDISMPERFEKQLAFLEQHPEIGALGSSVIITNLSGDWIKKRNYMLDPDQIKWATFFGNNAVHPTIMIRSTLFKSIGILYNEDLQTTQDYDLYVQIVTRNRLANLPEYLVTIRDVETGISANFSHIQKKNNLQIRKKLINQTLGLNFSENVIDGTRKPFIQTGTTASLMSILVIIMLRNRFGVSQLEEADRDYINHDVAYRIGKIIQNTKKRWIFFPFQLYVLHLRGELMPAIKGKFDSVLRIKRRDL